MANETRTMECPWDLTTYSWKIEADALNLFVKGLKDKKILGRKCPRCGTVYVPGTSYCRKCLIDIDQVVEVKSEGVLDAFTVSVSDIRGNPVEKPFITCTVRFDGSESLVMGTLEGWKDWHDVKEGMRIKVVFKDVTEGALADMAYFQLI
ncbi:MAG: Zn-ribbon domain-containing OB-fold protein [Deltaproteobacteria bacterium]|nr:Zn-ribbon domain-containing OB-fold protein [Deltaproteobacteria bacterium]MCL5276264.1 Zn-ribbon domain-containing OB-fold protein [Deltaproteobacteria bacterium]